MKNIIYQPSINLDNTDFSESDNEGYFHKLIIEISNTDNLVFTSAAQLKQFINDLQCINEENFPPEID